MEAGDVGMAAALERGAGARLAVIDGFVHGDGTLYLGTDADPHDTSGEAAAIDPNRLRSTLTASGARVLCVHTSAARVAIHCATDAIVEQSYEGVLSAASLADCDGIQLESGSSSIVLARTEVSAALSRRRRLAARTAREGSDGDLAPRPR